jgi:hypothetical protein
MMRTFILSFTLLLCSFLFVVSSAHAQCTPRNVAKKESLRLEMQSEGGTNGSAVAWNPVQRRYYAVIAGNGAFPLETFDQQGAPVYQTTAGMDTRGMWWNPRKNRLEANSYTDGAVFSLSVNGSGNALGYDQTLLEETALSDYPQSCAVVEPKKGNFLFYSDGILYTLSSASGKIMKETQLYNRPSSSGSVNEVALIYTGCKKHEIGLLDYETGKIYLFDLKSGKFTAAVELPQSAVTHDMFRTSYANGHLWLYDAETRVWQAYQIFE